MTDERDWALACVLGARDRTDNEKVRQGLLDAYHMLVTNQPTDEPTEADPYPDGLPEDLYVDIESTIHQHCGHDGQSDEANDWVTDLMSAISPPIVRALVGGRSAAPTREITISPLSDDVHDAILDTLTPWLSDDDTDVQEGLSDATRQVHRAVMARLATLAREDVLRTVRAALVDDAGMPTSWFPDEGGLVVDVVTDAVVALLSRSAAEPPAEPQPDTVAYNVAVLAAPACPLCRDTGRVTATGQGCDGFGPCPDCGVAAGPQATPAQADGPSEWVPWWDAIGRTLVSGDHIAQVRRTAAVQHPGPYELYVEMWSQNHECWCRPELDPDGRVEVQR